MALIKLPKREAVNDWIEIENGQSIKIDYPSGRQIHHLQDLAYDCMTEDGIDQTKFIDYCRYYIKYTIKNWKGDDLPPCILVKNALADDLWFGVTSEMADVKRLYVKIDESLKWDDREKKNSN